MSDIDWSDPDVREQELAKKWAEAEDEITRLHAEITKYRVAIEKQSKRCDVLRATLAKTERDAERYRWIESHVSEQLTEQSLQHEYSEHKTQYVLPKLIAWANFCGQITFAEAIDAAMAREEG